VNIITSQINRGNGASIKTGIRHSKGDILATVDADGTYPLQDFPKLLAIMYKRKADMVVGARTKTEKIIPLTHWFAKGTLKWLAARLTKTPIPDINSGMRLFTRELGERFMHLFPERFSSHITITLAALTNGYLVHYEPITYARRIGVSKLSTRTGGVLNFLNFLGLVVRIIMYFNPLRFFAWPSIVCFCAGIFRLGYTMMWDHRITLSGVLLFLSGLLLGTFGLLAEDVARNRQAP
jgi:glycosyltransferase involved in cell wall biosynthesis